MNTWCFTGNLGSDCEMRYTPSGTPICGFSVAVTAGYGDKKTTTWVRCSIIGNRSEKVAPYLLKGQQVAVSGEAKLREWTTKDGATKSSLEVTVNDVTLVGGKPEARQQAPAQQPAAQADDFEDDIPW